MSGAENVLDEKGLFTIAWQAYNETYLYQMPPSFFEDLLERFNLIPRATGTGHHQVQLEMVLESWIPL